MTPYNIKDNYTDTSYLNDPIEEFLKSVVPETEIQSTNRRQVRELDEGLQTIDKSANQEIDPVKLFWDEALRKLRNMAVPEHKARMMIGKWLKQTGDDRNTVMAAIDEAVAKGTMEPVSFIVKILDKKPLTTYKQGKRKEIDDAFQWLREKGAERRAQWEADAGRGDGDDHVGLQSGGDIQSPEVHVDGDQGSGAIQSGDAVEAGGPKKRRNRKVEVPAVDSGTDF